MEIPMYIMLFVYIAFLAIFTVLMLINIYHIIMTASLSMVSFFSSAFFLVLTFLILYATWWLTKDINWQQSFISLPYFNNFFQNSI